MSNSDDGKNPMPNDKGKGLMFTAFQNLSLQSSNKNNYNNNTNYNNLNLGESSNINNNNLNVQCSFGHFSLGGSALSASSFRAPPFITPSTLFNQQGASSSTNYFGQPLAYSQNFVSSDYDHDQEMLLGLVELMTCPTRFPEFLNSLERIKTYPMAKRESLLSKIGSTFTRTDQAFLSVALNQNGSHAIRSLLTCSPNLDGHIFFAVCITFPSLMNSKYGRYLVIPTIRVVDKPRKEMLYKLAYENTMFLAEKEYGCIALNAVLQEIKGTYRDLIFDLIAWNAVGLSFDPYGTHVVQNVLTLQNPRATQAIAKTLYGNFSKLAVGRNGSYVVEKCLKSEFGRMEVLDEFRENDYKDWIRIAHGKFGNFVAQCALKVMKQSGLRELAREFVEKLRPHFGEMKTGHGKNTLRLIQEEIEYWIKFPDDLLDF